MIDKGPHRCRSCRAALRRGHCGALCDPCARGARAQPPVPYGFFDTPAMRTALAHYDFGSVFRGVRSTAGLSQEALGGLLRLSQGRVSAIEHGHHRVLHIDLIVRIANALGIPAQLLGFGPNTDTSTKEEEEEVSWVDRREFFTVVTALSLGAGAAASLDAERLAALLPDPRDQPVPRRIGADDVQAIQTATAAFRAADFRHGGGLLRAAAVAQMGLVLKMREAHCSEPVRAELLLATAELGKVAAWMTYDVEQHDAARRLWMIALGAARESHHAFATDMMVHLQLEMANQAIHLRRPDEALRLARLADVTAANGDHPVSVQTRAYISLNQSQSHALLGRAEPCQRALGQAQEHAGNADPGAAPAWTAHVIPTEITAHIGNAMFTLAQRKAGDYAPEAVEQLQAAVGTFGDEYARSRAINLPGLAGAYVQVGDLDAAVATGHQAVTEISASTSTRIRERLRPLAEVAQPYSHRRDVAELRQRIRETLITSA